MSNKVSIYEDFGIERKYNDPTNYGNRTSHYGNGKYPPDWNNRREAVWQLQDYQCARCGTYKGDTNGAAVHHIVHLSNGGGNQLENLAGLCHHCHALMHPNLDYVEGSPDSAPLFPDRNAQEDVAVIRWPSGNDELKTDLENLSETSNPDHNREAVSDAVVPTSATDAKRAESDLPDILTRRGFVPRTSAYHSVEIDPRFPGLRGLVTRYTPEMTTKHDATVSEADDWSGILNHERQLRFTEDGTGATVLFEDYNGSETSESISFDGKNTAASISPVISPPPLTLHTIPTYAFDTILFLLWTIPTRGLLPALLITVLLPEVVPAGNTLVGFVALTLWFGILLTLPTIYKRL